MNRASSRLVAVTGATGFVGPHLVRALVRHGWTVRLLIRRWKPVPELDGASAELVLGDLADERALQRLTDGADAVVHAAGLIKARSAEAFMAVNRDGTASLSRHAPKARLLLLSSLAAREPGLSPYAASKQAAEEVLKQRAGPWLAVRAPAVYGPGDRETLAYFKTVDRGFAPRPAVPEARLSLIHVADLVEALALGLEADLRPSVYEVDDGRPGGHSYDDMARAAGQALGRQPLGLSVPRVLLATLAAVNGLRQSLTGKAEILTAGKVAEMFHPDWTVHDRRLAETTTFVARYDLPGGFADTVAWYREHHWLRNR